MAMPDLWCSSKPTSNKIVFKWNIRDLEQALTLGKPSATDGSRKGTENIGKLESPPYTSTVDRDCVRIVDSDEGSSQSTDRVSISWNLEVNLVQKPASRYQSGLLTFHGQVPAPWQNADRELHFHLRLRESLHKLQARMKLIIHLSNQQGEVTSMESKIVTIKTKATTSSVHGRSYRDVDSVYVPSCKISTVCPSEHVQTVLANHGDLKICCELSVWGDVTHTPMRSKPIYKQLMSHDLELGAQMASLREEGFLTDFTLAVPGKKFNVHKVILAARSPVFRRMIETNMREKREGRIVIKDITAEVAEEMVTYMYTGKAPRMLEMTDKLFEVADKYEMEQLKLLCEEALCNKLTMENAINTLLLAEMHSAGRLRAVCIELIEDNISQLKEMDGWERLKNSPQFHDLYVQLLESQLTPACKKAKLVI